MTLRLLDTKRMKKKEPCIILTELSLHRDIVAIREMIGAASRSGSDRTTKQNRRLLKYLA
ncbi:MAG: hypothetical protein V1729_02990 [Candidatus Woesearchaeota archaeon]